MVWGVFGHPLGTGRQPPRSGCSFRTDRLPVMEDDVKGMLVTGSSQGGGDSTRGWADVSSVEICSNCIVLVSLVRRWAEILVSFSYRFLDVLWLFVGFKLIVDSSKKGIEKFDPAWEGTCLSACIVWQLELVSRAKYMEIVTAYAALTLLDMWYFIMLIWESLRI